MGNGAGLCIDGEDLRAGSQKLPCQCVAFRVTAFKRADRRILIGVGCQLIVGKTCRHNNFRRVIYLFGFQRNDQPLFIAQVAIADTDGQADGFGPHFKTGKSVFTR